MASVMAATSFSWVTSAVKISAVPPCCAIASRACFNRAVSRATSAMEAPASANAFAMASPRPRLPPVITAVRPVRLMVIGASPLLLVQSSEALSRRQGIDTGGGGLDDQPGLRSSGLRIEIEPAESRYDRQNSHDFEDKIPVSARVRENHSSDHRRDKSAEVAEH